MAIHTLFSWSTTERGHIGNSLFVTGIEQLEYIDIGFFIIIMYNGTSSFRSVFHVSSIRSTDTFFYRKIINIKIAVAIIVVFSPSLPYSLPS